MTVAEEVRTTGPVRRPPADFGIRRRKLVNRLAWILCAVALALVVIPVVSIVGGVVAHALPGWRWDVLTTSTTATGGGLLNAIVGTLLLMAGVAVLAGSLGVAGGIFLAEYSGAGEGTLLRGASEVLAGVPSIVLGYVGYTVFVVAFHWGYSLGAALIVLSALVVPYIAKTTEVAIRQVPTGYREGAEALGMRSLHALRKVVLRPALPGIATGLIVAIAISTGETAPLLYTAGYSNSLPSLHLAHAPIGYLTYVVWTYYDQPGAAAHTLAHQAALLLIVMVVLMIVLARVIVSRTQRYAPDRQSGK